MRLNATLLKKRKKEKWEAPLHWKDASGKIHLRQSRRGKEHPVERLVQRNGGEQPGTSPTAMSETHSIADSNGAIHGGSVDRVKEDKAGRRKTDSYYWAY